MDPSTVAQELGRLIEEDKVQTWTPRSLTTASSLRRKGFVVISVDCWKKESTSFDPEKINQAIEAVEKIWGFATMRFKRGHSPSYPKQGLYPHRGPGTGKTTVINGMISVYAHSTNWIFGRNKTCRSLLAAPTGRAARRMNELTGLPSATIHRHLGMTGDDDTSHLEDYLDADFIIVDEFSMVDTWLANQLLSNIATDTKLLIVGDADQLPSVSPGQGLG